jgi:hypothetical protein
MSLLGIIASQNYPRFSPLDLPNLKAWYDAADTSSISGGSEVNQWNDKSANGFHLAQATSTYKPSSGTRTLNSKNVIDFDGTNDFLQASTAADWTFLNNSGASTAFYVLILDDNSKSNGFADTGGFDSGNVDYEIYHNAGGEGITHRVGNANAGAGPVQNITNNTLTNAAHYFHLISDPNNGTAANRSIFVLDGVAANKNNARTSTPSSSAPNRALTVGNRSLGDGVYAFNGAMAEIIFVSGIMSAGNITATTDYLTAKWGL